MTVPPFDPRSARRRVLLVEDTSVLREIQVLLLRSAGYEATSCCDTSLAIAHAEQHPVDLVILNSDRPEIFSARFITALRSGRPALPILALVAGGAPGAKRALQRLGVSRIADRPLHPAQLLQEIDHALGDVLSPSAPKHYLVPPEAETPASRHATPEGVRSSPQLPFSAVSVRVAATGPASAASSAAVIRPAASSTGR